MLEAYLTEKYPIIAAQLQELDLYVLQCANLLRSAFQEVNGNPPSWPYSYPEPALPKEISVSTQTMCSVAVEHLIGADIGESESPKLSELRERVLKATFEQGSSKLSNSKPAWESSTFGVEDAFTASWLVEVISKRTAPEDIVKAAVRIIRKALSDAVRNRFEKTLFSKDNDAGPHPLPLLRVFQSLEQIEKSTPIRTDLDLSELDRSIARHSSPKHRNSA